MLPTIKITVRPSKLTDERYSPWVYYSKSAFIRVYPGINIDALQQKLDSIEVENSMQGVMSYKLIPLKEVHYTIPNADTNIKFNHLRIFVGVALLVFLCALFNYVMLFINRIKVRSRELALRKVTGSGTMQLLDFAALRVLDNSAFIAVHRWSAYRIAFPRFHETVAN